MKHVLKKFFFISLIISIVVSTFPPFPLSAHENHTPQPKETPESIEEPELEPDQLMAKWIFDKKNRILLKRNTLELAPFIGPMYGDALQTTLIYGMRTNYHITEQFAIGIDGGFAAAEIDSFSFENDSYFFNGNLAWHFPTIYLVIKDLTLRGDLFITGGAGAFNLIGDFKPTGFVGGGTKIYFHRWIVLRIDVRNYIIPTDFAGGGEITSNAVFMFGLSFFLPNRIPE